jgi:integrase
VGREAREGGAGKMIKRRQPTKARPKSTDGEPRQMKAFTREEIYLFDAFFRKGNSSTDIRDLALMWTAVDTALRSIDIVNLKVSDIAKDGVISEKFIVTQQKTKEPVCCKINDNCRGALLAWLVDEEILHTPDAIIFAIGTRHYQRLVRQWCGWVGIDPTNYCTHSFRRTKSTIAYDETKDFYYVKDLLGSKSGNIEMYIKKVTREDALALARQFDI